jgi:LmbE family N-acetylglucosaminyl deacetylase/SAM-dependent methyltransferase
MAFDHRERGTPAAAWQPTLDAANDLAAPGAGDHVVVVAAHQDDETLGAGGLLALASSRGARITVIVACDGEASHPTSPTHAPELLARLRRREVRLAVEELAPKADLVLLGLPDGRLAEHRAEITVEIDEAGVGCTHLVTPWAGDGHPDHTACADAATHSIASLHAEHWQFPIWAWHWGDPSDSRFPAVCRLRLDADAQQAKVRALACHVSQHRALSDRPGDEPVIGPHVLDHFRRDVEAFVVSPGSLRVPDAYFAGLYERAADPWGLADRFYEQRKRAMLLAALTRPRFRRAFEPGCATGLLTAQLAQRCDEVVAWDIVTSAVEQTAARVADFDNVTIAQGAVPDDWPDGDFDLIVLSEVGYYCTDPNALARRVARSLTEDGVLVACHWRHEAAMHPQTAEAVHSALGAGQHLLVDHVEDDFLLQVWSRGGRSVAAADGIVP